MKNILKTPSWQAALTGLIVLAASGAGLFFAVAQDAPPVFDASNTNADANLEDAPGKLVSTPDKALPASIDPQSPAAEIIKLAQAGVDESVMLAFIASSSNKFSLSSDAIVYLNDLGVPSTVVTSMIQHDQGINPNVAAAPSPNPATYAQTSDVIPTVTAPLATVEQAPPQVNVTYSYFYDSLSPYGNWIDVQGYGLCWQPTTGVVDRGWQPYGARGRWVYSDVGWYWASDYSWGWAPFHYGRWFRHTRWGWCWAPDTTWGPSWVSWRYDNNYCGWAPLPPTARFTSGVGFTYYGRGVTVGFDFGIRADRFTFVPFNRFCDPHPFRNRASRDQVTKIYNKTVIVNNIHGNNNTIINNGIPFERVAAASPTPIRRVSIRESSLAPSRGNARAERFDPAGRTLTVYRPQLPQATTPSKSPFVGAGVKADPNLAARNASQFSNRTRTESARTTERNPASLPDRGQRPAANPTPVVNRSPNASQPDKQNESQQNRSVRGRDPQPSSSTRNAVQNNPTPSQPVEQKPSQNPAPVIVRRPGSTIQPPQQSQQTVTPRNTFSRPEQNQSLRQNQPATVVPPPSYTAPQINRPVTRTERPDSTVRQQDAPGSSPRQERSVTPQPDTSVQSPRGASAGAPSRSEGSARSNSGSSNDDKRSTDSGDQRDRSGRDPRNR